MSVDSHVGLCPGHVSVVCSLGRFFAEQMVASGSCCQDSMEYQKGQLTSFQCYVHVSKESEGHQNSEVVVAREGTEKSQGNEIKDLCKNFSCSV